jgi:hypothetical protein
MNPTRLGLAMAFAVLGSQLLVVKADGKSTTLRPLSAIGPVLPGLEGINGPTRLDLP